MQCNDCPWFLTHQHSEMTHHFQQAHGHPPRTKKGPSNARATYTERKLSEERVSALRASHKAKSYRRNSSGAKSKGSKAAESKPLSDVPRPLSSALLDLPSASPLPIPAYANTYYAPTPKKRKRSQDDDSDEERPSKLSRSSESSETESQTSVVPSSSLPLGPLSRAQNPKKRKRSQDDDSDEERPCKLSRSSGSPEAESQTFIAPLSSLPLEPPHTSFDPTPIENTSPPPYYPFALDLDSLFGQPCLSSPPDASRMLPFCPENSYNEFSPETRQTSETHPQFSDYSLYNPAYAGYSQVLTTDEGAYAPQPIASAPFPDQGQYIAPIAESVDLPDQSTASGLDLELSDIDWDEFIRSWLQSDSGNN